MFGAPAVPAKKHPGFGDHVELFSGYLGLIVDIDDKGLATVATRTIGGKVTESDFNVARLTKARTIPLGLDQCAVRDWKRLG